MSEQSKLRKRSEVKATTDVLPRAPDGFINNCQMAMGIPADGGGRAPVCQMCNGVCPDAARGEEPAAFIERMILKRGQRAEAISAELVDAIAEEEAKDAAITNPLAWGSANKAEMVDLSPEFQAIVTSVFIDDVKGTYDKLEAALKVGNRRTDYGTVMKHLDLAERHARDAHRLWQTGIVEYKRWEADNEVVFSSMRSEATRALQHEKDQKLRAKQITDADVDARIATLYPDEWRAQQSARGRNKAMLASLENLSEVWMSRCRTLQTILTKQR